MIRAGQAAQVGPMAAVAGAIAQCVAQDLRSYARDVFVENGGDIYADTKRPLDVAVFAGPSPLSNKVILHLEPHQQPLGMCTSSATVGPSRSFGHADAVCILSPSAALADAVATAVGNHVKSSKDISKAIDYGRNIPNITGIIVIIGGHMGIWGDVTLRK